MNRLLKIQNASILVSLFVLTALSVNANDWDGIAIPADAGTGKVWELQDNVSDNFNYETPAVDAYQVFDGKWKNEYVNGWEGSGGAKHAPDKSHVTGGNLCLESDFVGEDPDQIQYYADNAITYIHSGNISSLNTVNYPMFAEARVKMNEIPMACAFWMISLDQTEEIDILEAFGTDRPDQAWYSQRLHLSHHTFIRSPFQDYQPRDTRSWYTDNGRRWSESYFRIGVYWKGPFHLEYYVDGEKVRVLYNKALANRSGDTWIYSYPIKNSKDSLPIVDGYQTLTQYSTSAGYSFAELQAAGQASSVSIIDAYNYLGGNGLTKNQYLVFSIGQQTWSNIYPSVEELADAARSVYKVDWVRVYKLVDATLVSDVTEKSEVEIYPNPASKYLIIKGLKYADYQIRIFDMQGKTVKSLTISGFSNNISIKDLPADMYILQIGNKGEVLNQRFIKE